MYVRTAEDGSNELTPFQLTDRFPLAHRLTQMIRPSFPCPNQSKSSVCFQASSKILTKPSFPTEADDQTSGRAAYTIDLGSGADTLQGAFVVSTMASANIVSIDPTDALASPGVVDFISYKDIPGRKFIEALTLSVPQ